MLPKLPKNKKVAILIIVINGWWIYEFAWLWHAYHFSSLLFLIMYPDWIMALNITVGFLGIIIGVALFFDKLTIRRALWLDGTLLGGTFLLSNLMVSGF
ncbi:MAG: hypothetical protein DWQ02_26155 [Bacteroidetes bacterium]|nr:MAG: hypothetical protein DWQ02_26155 [Bacteroidota bacterium]